MLSPNEAMRQAHETAHEYAIYGVKAFEAVTGLTAKNNPQATAMFVAGFMQAASTDFVGWAIQNQIEKLRDTLGQFTDGFIDLGASLRDGEVT